VTAELGRQLGDGYLLNPSVTVDIAAYRAVYILGEVAKPGQYPYTEGMTIYQLAAQAGGFTYRANRKKISLRHDNEQNDRKVAITNGTAVAPGDTVVIHQRFF
jgi:polysaccharide export outer membrane protein